MNPYRICLNNEAVKSIFQDILLYHCSDTINIAECNTYMIIFFLKYVGENKWITFKKAYNLGDITCNFISNKGQKGIKIYAYSRQYKMKHLLPDKF